MMEIRKNFFKVKQIPSDKLFLLCFAKEKEVIAIKILIFTCEKVCFARKVNAKKIKLGLFDVY